MYGITRSLRASSAVSPFRNVAVSSVSRPIRLALLTSTSADHLAHARLKTLQQRQGVWTRRWVRTSNVAPRKR
jgi:hypothetical protein